MTILRGPVLNTVQQFQGTLYMQADFWVRKEHTQPKRFNFLFCAKHVGRQASEQGYIWRVLGIFDIEAILNATTSLHRYVGWKQNLRTILIQEIASVLKVEHAQVYGLEKIV